MKTDTNQAAGAIVGEDAKKLVERSSPKVDEPAAPAKKKAVAVKPKAATSSKTRKAAPPPSRATSKTEKLVCRYCGSDDLAPSFKKRRDARCRACFKKRYGSAARSKSAKRARKAKAAK